MRSVVGANTEGRRFGIFVEPRGNVLLLDIALDSTFQMPRAASAAALAPPTH